MNAWENLVKVRERKPLVHHITNWVTIYDCANMTRAFGALPVMAHAPEEVEEMTGIADALVLNIGTLTSELIESMIMAGKAANRKGIPIVVDAVGVGATKMRTEKMMKILENCTVDIVKGNASEIGILAGAKSVVKGVEAISVEGDMLEIAKKVASDFRCTAVITGVTDIVTDNKTSYKISNGHEMMGSIVGTGCMAASVIGSFAAVEKNYASSAASALVCYGIAGELAAKGSSGPGTFKERFFDSVYGLSEDNIKKMAKVKKS